MTLALRLLLAALAIYRAAQFLAYDEGPGQVMQLLRESLGVYELAENGMPRSALGRLFQCPYCLGVWIALPAMALCLMPSLPGDAALIWLGLAGAQSFLQDHSRRGA